MKLFRIFLTFFIIIGLFWAGSLFFPHAYKVDRSIIINKPANEIYNFMQDLRNWEKWSLWNKQTDSTLTSFYGQRSDSIGGRQYFRGELLGIGRFEIHDAKPNEFIAYHLYMHAGNVNANGSFRFVPKSATETEMHWIDSGDVGNNPIFRYMMLSKISSTEKAFDEGLARIKDVLEE